MATSRKSGDKAKADSNVDGSARVAPPDAEELRAAFAAGKIPVEGDFHNLIMLADAGAHLSAGNSLDFNEDKVMSVTSLSKHIVPNPGGLALSFGTASCIESTNDNLMLKVNKEFVINSSNHALSLNLGSGIELAEEDSVTKTRGVSVKAKEGGSIEVNADGVAVQITEHFGIMRGDDGGIRVQVDTGKGLNVDENGLKVSYGNGLWLDGNKLAVKARSPGGLQSGDTGISVKPGDGIVVTDSVSVEVDPDGGIQVGTDGVAVKLLENGGIEVGGEGMKVSVGLGIELLAGKVAQKMMPTRACNEGESGYIDTAFEFDAFGNLCLNIDNGRLTTRNVDGYDCLTVHPTFPARMITLFAGDVPPKGWVVCDGNNKTPNLKSKFITDEARSKDGEERYSLTYIMLDTDDSDDATPPKAST